MTDLQTIERLMLRPAEKSIRSTQRITFFAGLIAVVFLVYLIVVAIFLLA